MTLREEPKHFFILYNNGINSDTFYFTVNSDFEIYCTKFKNIYESNRKRGMPGAHALEFTGNSFKLTSATGETIYSLEDYQRDMNSILPMQLETITIERLYIDEDVRIGLLAAEKIKYDAEASQIPGLLYEPKDESQAHTRARRPQHSIKSVHKA